MRKIRTAVLAGGAALCLAGTAMAASNDSHVMRVNLPDGSVAQIEYKGDVAPDVRIDPAAPVIRVRVVDPFDAAPFAAFDRVFADMGRQVAAMMRQTQALQASSGDVGVARDLASLRDAPAGTVSYSFVLIRNGNQVCSRSWRMTAQGAGQQPKLVSTSAGDCDAAAPGNAPAKSDTVSTAPAKPAAESPTV